MISSRVVVVIVVGFTVVIVVVTVVGLAVVVVEVVVTVVGLAVVVDLVEVVLVVVVETVVVVLSVWMVVTAGFPSAGSFCGVGAEGCETMATKNKTPAAVTAIHRLMFPFAKTFCTAASGIINTAAMITNRLVQ